jgi:diacylglycerol kinase (ATP)
MNTLKLIVNPWAGRGAAGQLWPEIQAILSNLGIQFEATLTTQPSEALEIARRASLDGYKIIVAVGGDGTVNEVVNGLMHAAGEGQAGTLGVIPLGSGNDFIKALAIPAGLDAACRRLIEGRSRLIDVGRVNNHYFVNGVGLGLDAKVAIESLRINRLAGMPLYVVALFRTLLFSYSTPRATIRFDGQIINQTITLCWIGNGRCSAGGFWLSPDAQPDDGLLDVVIGRGLNRLEILRLIPEVMRGTHVDKEPVTMVRTRRLIVELDEPLPVHAEGEIIYPAAQYLEFEIIPNKLRVIV